MIAALISKGKLRVGHGAVRVTHIHIHSTYFVKKKTIIFNIFSLKENIHSFFVRNFCSKRTVRIPESLIQNVLILHKNLNSGHEKKHKIVHLIKVKERV